VVPWDAAQEINPGIPRNEETDRQRESALDKMRFGLTLRYL
jgi:hypothetical protein